MQRYKAVIAYDGTRFSGYQIQPNGRTVQAELEKTLTKMHRSRIQVTASGRTDAGVHAKGQVIHFDSALMLPPQRWLKALNGLLPADIAVCEIEAVSSHFHARFDAIGKTYKYIVYTASVRDPFRHGYTAYFPFQVNIDDMRHGASLLVGTHDFTSFCSAKTEVENKIRTISDIRVEQNDAEVTFTFTGNGFLYNMVRILVGTLLDVGVGKTKAGDIPAIIQGKDRALAGKTAPAEGLYLWKVYY